MYFKWEEKKIEGKERISRDEKNKTIKNGKSSC